jgi:hypothetical protein
VSIVRTRVALIDPFFPFFDPFFLPTIHHIRLLDHRRGQLDLLLERRRLNSLRFRVTSPAAPRIDVILIEMSEDIPETNFHAAHLHQNKNLGRQ